MRKEFFIKGRQETLQDVISFIANIVVFARFWIKMPASETNDLPLIIEIIMELADFLSS